MNFLFVHSDLKVEWNSSEWRCVIPAEAINTLEDHKADLIDVYPFSRQFDAYDQEDVIKLTENADVIIIQRNAFFDTSEVVTHYLSQGKRIIVDVDDGYKFMRRDVPSFKYWIDGVVTYDGRPMKLRLSPYKQLSLMTKFIGNISSPSKQILSDYKPLGVNTIYVPNYPRLSNYLPFKRRRDPSNKTIHIGWGGSHTHYNSFKESGIVYALERVLKRHKDVMFYLSGGDPRTINLFRTVHKQMRIMSWVDFNRWPSVMNKIDIGLVPLSGLYDMRRSWIKPLEMFIMGIPWIASPNEAYEEVPGGTIIEKNTAKFWEDAIEYYLSHYEEVKQNVIDQEDQIEKFGSIYNAEKLVRLYSGE